MVFDTEYINSFFSGNSDTSENNRFSVLIRETTTSRKQTDIISRYFWHSRTLLLLLLLPLNDRVNKSHVLNGAEIVGPNSVVCLLFSDPVLNKICLDKS